MLVGTCFVKFFFVLSSSNFENYYHWTNARFFCSKSIILISNTFGSTFIKDNGFHANTDSEICDISTFSFFGKNEQFLRQNILTAFFEKSIKRWHYGATRFSTKCCNFSYFNSLLRKLMYLAFQWALGDQNQARNEFSEIIFMSQTRANIIRVLRV